AVVAYHRAEPRNPYMEYEDLFDMQLMLLTSPDHPLARKRHITAADIVRYPIIQAPKGSYSRDALDQILQRDNLQNEVHVVMENNTADVIRKYVAAGTGIALQYIGGETEPFPGLRQRLFDPSFEKRPVGILIRKGACLSGPAETFRVLLRRCFSGNRR